MREIPVIVLMGGLLVLTACASRGISQTEANPPSVSYSYTDDDDYDRVAELADEYCDTYYDADAELLDRDQDDDGYEAVFTCQQ